MAVAQQKTATKSSNALRTIGEASEEIGVEQHVLRFWENRFTQLKPEKRRGRRYYTPKDIALLQAIKELLYERGYTIRGVQNFLANHSKKNIEEIIAKASQMDLLNTISQEAAKEEQQTATKQAPAADTAKLEQENSRLKAQLKALKEELGSLKLKLDEAAA